MEKLIRWLRKNYNRSIHSIGFYPAMMALLFLLFAIFVYRLEESATAINLKKRFIWLNLKNTEAARAIITTVATGIIGLTVFSFSMVMVVMGQAASQMTNRLLDNFIGNKFQKVTLGFYLGTIINSFFLLSVMDDRGTTQVPSLSVFFLVLLTIVDLFLFVSFLHYITQSVRFEKLIKNIHLKTLKSLDNFSLEKKAPAWNVNQGQYLELTSPISNYFQGINRKVLLKLAAENNWQVAFCCLRCTYIIKGEPLLRLYYSTPPNETQLKNLLECIDFYTGQEVDKNPFYGYLHLSEVAIKALSPGINDPNTAVLSIHSLTDLLAFKLNQESTEVFCDKNKVPRIFIKERTAEELFQYCIYPILDYGKKDRFVRNAFMQMISQLRIADKQKKLERTLHEFEKELTSENKDAV